MCVAHLAAVVLEHERCLGLLEAQMTGHGRERSGGQIFENLPVRRARTALPCFQKSLENLPL